MTLFKKLGTQRITDSQGNIWYSIVRDLVQITIIKSDDGYALNAATMDRDTMEWSPLYNHRGIDIYPTLNDALLAADQII